MQNSKHRQKYDSENRRLAEDYQHAKNDEKLSFIF